MKSLTLGATLLIFCAGCATVKRSTVPPYQPSVASRALDIEAEVFDVQDAHELLARVVSESVRRVKASGLSVSSTNALALINETIKSLGFRRKTPKESELVVTFADGLCSRCLDCSDYCLIFLEVGHQLGVSFRVMYMPKHIVLVADTPQGEVYWETLSADVKKREWYVNDSRLGPDSHERGTYLTVRDEESILGSVCLEIGIRLALERRYALAEIYLRRGVELHQTSASLWSCLGYVLGKEGCFAESDCAFMEAMSLDPKYRNAYFTFGEFLEERAEWDRAGELYQKLMSFNPGDLQAFDKYLRVWLRDIDSVR